MENINPNRNPFTTITGFIFILLSLIMTAVKYLASVFFTLKGEVLYPDYIIGLVLFVGLLLVFMTDAYFARIFDAILNFFKKKTDTQ